MVDPTRSFGLSLRMDKFENSLKSKERSTLRVSCLGRSMNGPAK